MRDVFIGSLVCNFCKLNTLILFRFIFYFVVSRVIILYLLLAI